MCRGRAIERHDLNPATAHLVDWFNDINSDRTFTIVAGMGGGASIPNAIRYQDLDAWACMAGSEPTPWEVQALRAMDQAWRAAYQPSGSKTGRSPVAEKQHQAVGEYCSEKHLEECRKQFGSENLERICATCPN